VKPSRSFARGDVTVHPTPTTFGYWRLRIDGPHGELNGYLSELLDCFAGRELELAHAAENLEATITMVADLAGDEGELTISSSLLARIAAINTQLRLYWIHEPSSSDSAATQDQP
jgi:hypothetical protein